MQVCESSRQRSEVCERYVGGVGGYAVSRAVWAVEPGRSAMCGRGWWVCMSVLDAAWSAHCRFNVDGGMDLES